MATRCEYKNCTGDGHYLRIVNGKRILVCDRHKHVK
jgi:hypothetical protein